MQLIILFFVGIAGYLILNFEDLYLGYIITSGIIGAGVGICIIALYVELFEPRSNEELYVKLTFQERKRRRRRYILTFPIYYSAVSILLHFVAVIGWEFTFGDMTFDVIMTVMNAIFQSIIIFVGYLLFLWLTFALSMIAHEIITPYHGDVKDMTDDKRWETYFLTSPIRSVPFKEVRQLLQESKQLMVGSKTDTVVSSPKYSLDLWDSKLVRLEIHKHAEKGTLMIYVIVAISIGLFLLLALLEGVELFMGVLIICTPVMVYMIMRYIRRQVYLEAYGCSIYVVSRGAIFTGMKRVQVSDTGKAFHKRYEDEDYSFYRVHFPTKVEGFHVKVQDFDNMNEAKEFVKTLNQFLKYAKSICG